MSVIRDLAEGALYLLPIGLGAGLVYHYGRDRTAANEHDLWAPHDEPTAVEPEPVQPVALTMTLDLPDSKANPALDRRIRPAAALTGPVGLAAWETSARMDGPVPPLARALMIEHAVPTLSDAAVRGIAAEMLQEIAAEQQARAGIRAVVDHWAVLDGSCYDDCPACARDMTGSFAVLAVA